MSYTLLYAVSFGISAGIIAAGAATGVFMHRAELRKTLASRHILTPFQAFALFFFFSAVTAQLPSAQLIQAQGFWDGARAVLLAMLRSLQMFTLNGDFGPVSETLLSAQAAGMDGAFANVYGIFMGLMYLAAPLFTAGVVLSLFREAATHVKYFFRRGRDVYMFSDLNERSLALAKDILGKRKDRHPGIVFANVSRKAQEELVMSAKALGALCFRKEILDLSVRNTGRALSKTREPARTRIYLIGDDEDVNLSQALRLIERHKDANRLEIYVYSVDAESEALLNTVDNGCIKVRRVDENRNLAYREMLRHPIFEHYVEKDGKKHICILIVGLGGYGWELLKAICWLGQMPGYSVEVHVFDKEKASEKVRRIAPEFFSCNHAENPAEAQYAVVFHDDLQSDGTGFLEQVAAVKDITGIYVTLGDDERNIETALRIRIALGRDGRTSIPSLYAVVYSEAKTSAAAGSSEDLEGGSGGGLKNMKDESYGITLVGSLHECYSLEAVEQTEPERDAEALHIRWAERLTRSLYREAVARGEDPKEAEKTAHSSYARYCGKFRKYEYFRRCSLARAVYRDLRRRFTDVGSLGLQTLSFYEHSRWSTFMRAEGYVKGPRDDIAKMHDLLVPYDELPEEERITDED